MQKDLLPPADTQQELQGHSVSFYADLDRSLRASHFPLLSKTTLVLLQKADAFHVALQRTNHSSVLQQVAGAKPAASFCRLWFSRVSGLKT